MDMKIIIKRSTEININLKKVRSLKNIGKFNANRFCGAINIKDNPIEIQKQMRNEW